MIDAKLQQFIDDVCIVFHGEKANFVVDSEESFVIMESMVRLSQYGRELVKQRAAQMKLKSLQEAVASHRRICAEDNIILKD